MGSFNGKRHVASWALPVLIAMTATGAVAAMARTPDARTIPADHRVSFTIEHRGMPLGAPTLNVVPGRRAEIAVGGAHGYRLATTLHAVAGAATPQFRLENEIALADAGGFRVVATPVLTLAAGRAVTIETRSGDGPGDVLRVSATVEALPSSGN